MKMFSDCSGPCETCANNYELTGANCMAGHGDDHYVPVDPPENGDNCEVCLGRNGGVRGNENVVDNIVMCDYCTSDYLKERQNEKPDFRDCDSDS
jgi:hypothetical protein